MRRYAHPDCVTTANVVAYGVNLTVEQDGKSLTVEWTEDEAIEWARHLMWFAGYRALRIKRITGTDKIDINYECASPHQFQYLKDQQDAEDAEQPESL